jgi:hypothetical protein
LRAKADRKASVRPLVATGFIRSLPASNKEIIASPPAVRYLWNATVWAGLENKNGVALDHSMPLSRKSTDSLKTSWSQPGLIICREVERSCPGCRRPIRLLRKPAAEPAWLARLADALL